MRLSHSKLSTLIVNPKRYKAIYKIGLVVRDKKPALKIGEAVHYGIEHEVEDLSEFFKSGSFTQSQGYSHEQLLSESMVYGYFKHKDEIFNKLLKDDETGEQLELLDETHEIGLTADFDSLKEGYGPHSLYGIIDLQLLTSKGFILVDYKTSSKTPNYDTYLEQIYRYKFLIENTFPDIPVYKIAIINIRKTSIRIKKNETDFAFKQRIKFEYEINDEKHINTHVYKNDKLDKRAFDLYINNFKQMADFAENLDLTQNFWWNYGDNMYGKSEFYDICHEVKDSWLFFNKKDTIFDVNNKVFVELREARKVDMLAINNNNVLHSFEQFKINCISLYSINPDMNKEDLIKYLKNNFIVDDELLEIYWDTLQAEIISNVNIKNDNN